MGKKGKKRRLILWLSGFAVFAGLVGWAGWRLMRPARFALYEIQEKTVTVVRNGETRYLRRGSCKMRADCYLNDESEVTYVVPVDAAGKPLASAANIVFYAPFNGEHGDKAYDRFPWVREFAERWGCTVYSLRIVADTISVGEPELYYIYREAGWYPGILGIQDFLTARFQLPRRKLFMVGQSSGGTLIQRMAVAHPERIAAGACHGAGAPADWPVLPASATPPMLLLSCRGDGTNGSGRRAARAATGTSWRVWYGEPRPLNDQDKHSATPEGIALMQRFLLDAMAAAPGGSEEFRSGFGQLLLHGAPGETIPAEEEAPAAVLDGLLINDAVGGAKPEADFFRP